MAYKAIYRRFRPKKFEDLVGQENIATILKNQIKTENIAHAYLFSGIRGTGKTSAAKIFARAVNCLQPVDGEPCNICENCSASLDESLMDIIEIDAASNNKVEDIREIRDGINYPPSKGKYKVYIVDEVHMLSQSAFNAFLKTLEEPPSYVIFILATTEQQKIPATIISRCQKYEFKRISSEDIAKNMRTICDEVGFEIDDKSLRLIARNAEGAMRDALSILDQSIASYGDRVSYEDVLDSLGSVNDMVISDFMDKIISKSEAQAMDSLQEIISSGSDIARFAKDIIHYLRNMMLIKTGANCYDILEETEETINTMKAQAEKIDMDRIVDYIEAMNQAENSIKNSTQPRIVLELAVIKLLEYGNRQDLLDRIERLEDAIKSGNIPSTSPQRTTTVRSNKPMKKKSQSSTGKSKEPVSDKQTQKKDYSSKDISFNDILEQWDSILNYIKKEKISLHALITEGRVSSFKNQVLTVGFGDQFGFHKEAIDQAHNRETIENLISDFLKCNISVKFTMEEEVETEDEDISEDVIELFGKEKITIED